jgi:hypothetical protein
LRNVVSAVIVFIPHQVRDEGLFCRVSALIIARTWY